MLQLNQKQLVPAIKTSIALDKPLFIWSSPGLGKSNIMGQVAEEMDAQLVDIRLSMWDSVDIRGIPTVIKGNTHWNPPVVLPFEGNTMFDPSKLILMVFDEMMQTNNTGVLSVALQLVLERMAGEHKLMRSVRVIAASNRQSDRAGANRMPTALSNRFMHIELIAELDPWCTWAWGKDLNPLPIAFLRLRPDLLNKFDPSKGDMAFPTPRAWETVCKIVSAKLPPEIRYPLIAGTIGEGPAAELEAFMQVWEKMPNIDAILMTPATADIPTDPATLFAVTAALAQRAEKGNFGNICEYAQRLPQEYAMRLVKDSVKRKPDVQLTKAFNKFAVANANMWED